MVMRSLGWWIRQHTHTHTGRVLAKAEVSIMSVGKFGAHTNFTKMEDFLNMKGGGDHNNRKLHCNSQQLIAETIEVFILPFHMGKP